MISVFSGATGSKKLKSGKAIGSEGAYGKDGGSKLGTTNSDCEISLEIESGKVAISEIFFLT